MRCNFCFLLTIGIILVVVVKARAASMILQWTPSVSPGVVGYDVYYGTTSGNYSYKLNVRNADSVTISNLIAGGTYYFVATAYTGQGSQSLFSDQIQVVIPAGSTGTSSSNPTATVSAAPKPKPAPLPAPKPAPASTPKPKSTPAPNPKNKPAAAPVAKATPTPSPAPRSTAVPTRGNAPGGQSAKLLSQAAPAQDGAAPLAQPTTVVTRGVEAIVPTARSADVSGAPSSDAGPVTVTGASLVMDRVATPESPALLHFSVQSGHQYEVQATTDFQNWSSLWRSETITTNGSLDFSDADSKSFASRFYRVVTH